MRQNGTSFSVGIAQSSLFSCVIFNQNASPRVVSEKIIDAHFLCAEDHLPYQGRQYSNREFESIQSSLRRPFGMWNCKHSRRPIILGVSEPAYSPEELEQYQKFSREKVEIDGDTRTRYEWSQEQRRIETAIRKEKDAAILAQSSGDPVLRRELQQKINGLNNRYTRVSEAAGLEPRNDRKYVEGFRPVRQSAAMGHRKADPGAWPISGKKISADELSALKTYANDRNVDLRSFENFDGDTSLIHEFIDGIAEVAKDFPEVASKEHLLQLRCSFKIEPETYAVTTKRCISINANAYRNRDALSKDYEKQVKKKVFVDGSTYQNIVHHEMGHVVVDTYGLSANKIVSKADRSYKISLYATRDSYEAVAESFSAHYAGIDNKEALTIFSKCVKMVVERGRKK